MLRHVLIAVLTGRRNWRRVERANATWAHGLDNVFWFTDEHSALPRVVYSGPSGDRRSLMPRYCAALRASVATAVQTQRAHIFFLDDDTYLVRHTFERLVRTLPRDGRDVFVAQPCGPRFASGWRSFCGGAGWLISVQLAARLVAALPECMRAYPEEVEYDRLFARCLGATLNVTPTWNDGLHSQPPLFYYATASGRRQRPKGLREPITFHYLSQRRHRELDAGDGAQWHTLHALLQRQSQR